MRLKLKFMRWILCEIRTIITFDRFRREQKRAKCLRSIYSIHVSGSRSLLMFNFGCKTIENNAVKTH